MSKNPFNKQTVLQGALTLTVAWLIIRILGAVYRVPLGRMLGDVGLGIYAVPNQFYLLFFTLSSAGIPVAVASIISEKVAVGHYRDAVRTFRVARTAMLIIGLLFSILLFAGSGWLIESGLVPNPDAYLGMRAVAPVIFFAALTAAYRGFFQGLQNMRAVAFSQVADQVMLVAATLLFSYLLLPKGLAIAAAGANLGAVPGAVGATLMLVWLYRSQRRGIMSMVNEDRSGARESVISLLKRIFSTAIPVSFAAVAMAITAIIDHKLIVDRLQLVGYSHIQAIAQYGQFNQMAMSFINISIALALSLGSSMVPAVAELYTLKKLERIRHQLSQALKLVVIFSVPAAAGLYVLAHQLTLLVFAEASAGVPLAALAGVVIFWSLHLVTTGALQGMGKAAVPVRNLLIGIIIKLIITYYLTPTDLGIRAAAMGTVVIFLVSSVLNTVAISRLVRYKFNLKELFLRPVIASAVMSAGVFFIYNTAVEHMGGNTWPTLIAVAGGAVIYPVVLVALGGVRAEDMRRMPVIGVRAAAVLEKMGFK